MNNFLVLTVPNALHSVMNQYYRPNGQFIIGILTALIVAVAPRPAAGAQENKPTGSAILQQSRKPQLHIAVEDDRLTMNLRDADLREVLKQIEQQTKIAIHVSPDVTNQVSAELTGVTLEEALRQLLQQTPFSYGIVYGHGSAGAMIIKSVHVLADGKQKPAPPSGTAAAPAEYVKPEDSEAGRRLRKMLQEFQQKTMSEKKEPDNEAARRFREMIEKAQRSSQKDTPGPEIPRDLIDSLQKGEQTGQEPSR